MVNSAPNGFLLGIAVKYIIAHMFMDNNSQGSSHRPRAVGFRLQNQKDFIYENFLLCLLNGEDYAHAYYSFHFCKNYRENPDFKNDDFRIVVDYEDGSLIVADYYTGLSSSRNTSSCLAPLTREQRKNVKDKEEKKSINLWKKRNCLKKIFVKMLSILVQSGKFLTLFQSNR